MRARTITTNFTAGLLSPRMLGRVDHSRYFNGCQTLDNMLVWPQGPAQRRSGTRFIREAHAATFCRLLTFEYSSEQAYIIEAGHQYFRYFKDDGIIVSGGVPVLTATPYTNAQVAGIKTAQSADVMYLVHPQVQPGKLSRLSHTSWTYAAVTLTGAPYNGTYGWPAAVAFHEERLIFGGARTRPQRLDGSKTNDWETFTTSSPVQDTDSWGYSIGADPVCPIRWLAPWRQLIVGTIGGEFKVGTDNQTTGITPTNVLIRAETKYRCADIRPLPTSDALLFVQRRGGAGNYGRTIREWSYNLSADGYKGDDLTLLADHVTIAGIVDWAWVQDPIPSIWCVLADGTLAACTYWRDQQVVAWHRHIIAGGLVESIAAMPGAKHDEIWLVVRRTIQGQQRRYIEQMMPPFGDDNAVADGWFVDSGVSFSGSPTTSFSGLDHLEGETVAILADGAPQPPQQVVDGAITLPRPASKVVAGLPFRSQLQTMPLDVQMADGTSQGRKGNIGQVTVRLHRSLGCNVGTTFDRGEEVPFRRGYDPMDQPPPLFSGDKQVSIATDWERRAVCVWQDQPLPLTVLAVVSRVVVND